MLKVNRGHSEKARKVIYQNHQEPDRKGMDRCVMQYTSKFWESKVNFNELNHDFNRLGN